MTSSSTNEKQTTANTTTTIQTQEQIAEGIWAIHKEIRGLQLIDRSGNLLQCSKCPGQVEEYCACTKALFIKQLFTRAWNRLSEVRAFYEQAFILKKKEAELQKKQQEVDTAQLKMQYLRKSLSVCSECWIRDRIVFVTPYANGDGLSLCSRHFH